MIERDGYPAGCPCWVDTAQPDPQAAARFYGDLFGWEFENRMPDDAPGSYLEATLRGRNVAAVGSLPASAPPTAVWNTYIWVESAAETAAKVAAAGGRVIDEPFEIFDAGAMAVFADPAGAVFSAWQAKEHRGAQLVNEPGTWNFSNLNTRDPEGAKAFYGEVFGWEAATVDLGPGGEATMWRLPGYGEFLERLEPGVRERQNAAGAPEGFADAIGWMQAIEAEPFGDDVPSHWSVTFAVAEPDAVAARALELGGAVVVAPYDAGPARIAVLSDPQGAVFTISRYVGEDA